MPDMWKLGDAPTDVWSIEERDLFADINDDLEGHAVPSPRLQVIVVAATMVRAVTLGHELAAHFDLRRDDVHVVNGSASSMIRIRGLRIDNEYVQVHIDGWPTDPDLREYMRRQLRAAGWDGIEH